MSPCTSPGYVRFSPAEIHKDSAAAAAIAATGTGI
jgi:hypothetical protein